MCTPKVKTYHGTDLFPIAQINGRPVLQPACNRVMTLERCNSLKKKSLPKSPPSTKSTSTAITSFSAPNSPKSKTPKPALKLVDDPNGMNSNTDKNVVTPKSTPPRLASIAITKSKKCNGGSSASWEGITSSYHTSSLGGSYSSSLIVEAPGSIAVARREQVNLVQAQRKMRIAHYGRTPSKIEGKVFPIDSSAAANPQEKRCSFITPNSDPLYVAYHDEEWGVPVHEDRMLFELLVLTGAQVGLDWTSILRKRDEFRAAFSGFDIDVVANFNQRQIASISAEYGLDSSRVRGAVDNANCILEIRREFGSFDKYLWGFVNHKPISTNYKSCRKIPVKTSKSETMSKDMVRRGFRYVGPTVMHSFMQASGLTNDHLITCPRHLQCNAGAH